MSYCYKCGAKIENDDLFCSNCGAKKATFSNVNEDNSRETQGNNFNTAKISNFTSQVDFKSIINILFNMLIKPISTSKKFINETEKNITIMLTIFLLVIQGLLGMWRISQIISSISSIVINLVNKISAIASLIQPGSSSNPITSSELNELTNGIDKIKPFLKIPYGKIFLQNCALILIAILIIFVILCLANSMFSKNKGEIFKFYKTALIVTIPTLYFELFSIILSYLSINLGLIVALLGFIVSLVCLSIVVNESLSLTENCSVFVVSLAALLTIIILSACLQSFIYSDISTFIYTIINSIKNLNI